MSIALLPVIPVATAQAQLDATGSVELDASSTSKVAPAIAFHEMLTRCPFALERVAGPNLSEVVVGALITELRCVMMK
jgi:hypothetical protein